MSRKFKKPDYEKALDLQVSLRDVLPPNHLARFTVEIVSQLDLSRIYQKYSDEGAPAYAPEMMLGLLFYGYATGVFSSRLGTGADLIALSLRASTAGNTD
jgi:transposase